MKRASAALVALLAGSEQFIMADLYTFTLAGTLAGGSVLRYSAAPTAVSANGHTYALGPKFERSKTKVVVGTQVDEFDVRVYPEPTDLIGALPFLEAAWQGSARWRAAAARPRFYAGLWRYYSGNGGSIRRSDLRHRLQPDRH
jgi:hypothetical protein